MGLNNFILTCEKDNEELRKDINYYKNMTSRLKKENQELKKQLENCYCNRTDCSGRIKDSKVYDSLVQKVETQQKEFIKWLEDEIKQEENENTIELLSDPNSCRTPNLRYKENILKEILQKYKEIIGVLNEKS